MNKYQAGKEQARQKAIDYQYSFNTTTYYYSDIAYYTGYFRRLAKRYGLIKEFEENGII